ncbi:uncharacterized protein ColSpa_10776 [Colletotrichum spaethianum]|uniref:DUF7888 domain-containing protein n=1 Tax=Colletotrichum spaethianum TaxID=700344 RepID=A0AA37UPG2_9PEZI|nr:uncharacterized protein ColSpa_10776 [Colletotrichum spaethianum]GKT50595.1 hypothetical protein ColSpa_10776 [Colletotrichum spaethianum]
MRFSTVGFFFASALAVNGAAVPANDKADITAPINPEAYAADVETVTFTGNKVNGVVVTRSIEAESNASLNERQVGITAVVTAIGGGVMSVATGVAVNIVTDIIRAYIDWTLARETFTKQTTSEMWKRNPNTKKFHAAICYNKGYRVKDSKGIDGKASVTLRSNVFHVSYDCMYMNGPNQFWTDAEGGYINLSYTYDRNHCSFDQKTGDLTCW